MSELLVTAVNCAKMAGEYQKEKLWGDFSVSHKGESDLVTEVDKGSEKMIVEQILSAFPSHDILAEENLYDAKGSEYVWVIDPIDGTTNFVHGYPWFCISIACKHKDELVCGVVYAPVLNLLFTAEKGRGSFLNGRKINVSARSGIKDSLLATGFPYDRRKDNENNFASFYHFQLATHGIRRAGSAALDLASVAAGWLDGFWECKLKPWDVAAGALLVKEAGGKVSGYEGEMYDISNHHIVASNGALHSEMLEMLKKAEKEGIPR